ncbi:MAG: hypothetical protein HONDAALG_00505 [Gammaproteobacteria bacterium]|nr:hypothetical protein [Gammaproteobacteria bacterium]
MNTLTDPAWKRRGASLIWDANALATIISPKKVISLRQCFALRDHWPKDLPGSGGDALVVAGLEGCLDVLSREDAETWLEGDLRSLIFSFQEEYENQAALIFWLPSGKKRIRMNSSTESYHWLCSAPQSHEIIELGRCLWAGAEPDLARILDSTERNSDPDGPAWIGLHHPRSS